MPESRQDSPPRVRSQRRRWSDDGHVQLSELVAMRLREEIISGRLKKGQFLRIDAVAKSMGVSMTPVREGLLLLRSEAYVRLIPRRGFVVNGFSRNDLIDLFWAQAVIGAELASRAAARISAADIARLGDLQSTYEEAIAARDQPLVSRLGHQFHRIINLAAGSPRLALLMRSLTSQLPNRFYASIEGQVPEAAKCHPVILDAIARRDARAAASLMFAHIHSAGEHLLPMLERHGLWDGSSRKSAIARDAPEPG